MARTRLRYKSGPKKGRFMSNRAIAAKSSKKRAKPKKKTRSTTSKKGKTTMAKRRKSAKKGGRRRSTGKGKSSGKAKFEIAAAGAGFGYLEQMPDSFMMKMPQIQALGFDGTMAIALHFAANAMSGATRKWLGRGAEAYAGSFGLEFGRRGLQMMAQVPGDEGGRPAMVAGSVRYDEVHDSIEHGG